MNWQSGAIHQIICCTAIGYHHYCIIIRNIVVLQISSIVICYFKRKNSKENLDPKLPSVNAEHLPNTITVSQAIHQIYPHPHFRLSRRYMHILLMFPN